MFSGKAKILAFSNESAIVNLLVYPEGTTSKTVQFEVGKRIKSPVGLLWDDDGPMKPDAVLINKGIYVYNPNLSETQKKQAVMVKVFINNAWKSIFVDFSFQIDKILDELCREFGNGELVFRNENNESSPIISNTELKPSKVYHFQPHSLGNSLI